MNLRNIFMLDNVTVSHHSGDVWSRAR